MMTDPPPTTAEDDGKEENDAETFVSHRTI
jgi:hypothetical protein